MLTPQRTADRLASRRQPRGGPRRHVLVGRRSGRVRAVARCLEPADGCRGARVLPDVEPLSPGAAMPRRRVVRVHAVSRGRLYATRERSGRSGRAGVLRPVSLSDDRDRPVCPQRRSVRAPQSAGHQGRDRCGRLPVVEPPHLSRASTSAAVAADGCRTRTCWVETGGHSNDSSAVARSCGPTGPTRLTSTASTARSGSPSVRRAISVARRRAWPERLPISREISSNRDRTIRTCAGRGGSPKPTPDSSTSLAPPWRC